MLSAGGHGFRAFRTPALFSIQSWAMNTTEAAVDKCKYVLLNTAAVVFSLPGVDPIF